MSVEWHSDSVQTDTVNQKMCTLYIHHKQIFTKFCTFADMPDVITCANFGMKKLRGLGNTGGQILGSPIETTGHPYNSAALPHSL